jgi:hypothetical protein
MDLLSSIVAGTPVRWRSLTSRSLGPETGHPTSGLVQDEGRDQRTRGEGGQRDNLLGQQEQAIGRGEQTTPIGMVLVTLISRDAGSATGKRRRVGGCGGMAVAGQESIQPRGADRGSRVIEALASPAAARGAHATLAASSVKDY